MLEIRDACRALRATPLVTAVAVLSLTLGIGANVTLFSLANSLLLKPLPVPEPEHLAVVSSGGRASFTYPVWEQIRDRRQLDACAWWAARVNLAEGGPVEMADALWASGSVFDVLRVPAVLGRTFSPADDQPGGGLDGPVAVIGHGFWLRHFGGAADVLGRTLKIERVPFTIVGVAPAGFFGVEVGLRFDVALPLATEPLVYGRQSRVANPYGGWFGIMVRRRPGQSAEEVTSALRAAQGSIREATLPDYDLPEYRDAFLREPFTVTPAPGGASAYGGYYRLSLLALLAIAAAVLLVACANLATLSLARADGRRHEIGVRLALGASRVRIARALLTESLLMSGAAAIGSLLLAQWASRFLVGQLSLPTFPMYLDLRPDWRVLGFTALAGLVTTALFGTVPALRAARVRPVETLNAQGLRIAGADRTRLTGALVVVQVALSLALVVGAGLFARSLSALERLPLGLEPDPALIVTVDAERSAVDPEERLALYERLRNAAAATPGVERAAISRAVPLEMTVYTADIGLPGQPPLQRPESTVFINFASPGWFRTLGIRLLAGRDFDARDRTGAPAVAVVNEAFARHYLADAPDPIGRTVLRIDPEDGSRQPVQVVGLVADAIYGAVKETPLPPTMYLALAQATEPAPLRIQLSVRAASESPVGLAPSLGAALGRVDPDVTLSFWPLASRVKGSFVRERTIARLSSFFGGLALLLAGLGVYGITAYAVSRRRTEIGVRMALGAGPPDVVWLVLRRVIGLVAIGIAAGGMLSQWVARLVEGLLYGVQPRDPLTLVIAAAVLVAVGVVATWYPARRAARTDPSAVLRTS